MKQAILLSNPEAKKSTQILTLILTAFLLLQLLFFYGSLQRQKMLYIDLAGSIAAKAAQMMPQKESQIVPLVTADLTDADRQQGRQFLEEYGITEQLSSNLFPNVQITFAPLVLSVILCLVLFLFHYRQYAVLYGKIRDLTQAARKILDADYSPAVQENGEGDFAKLSVEFSNIRRVIQNNIEQTQKEKQQLVDLLQNISHQFKTKLATMMLYNDILLNRKITEEQRIQFLQDNAAQLANMNSMIQRILKLAKLDAHVVEYEKKPTGVAALLGEVAGDLRQLAAEKGVQIQLKMDADDTLSLDHFWMKEALQNIVKNCVEHTNCGGSVAITTTAAPLFFKIVVQDTGEGIDRVDLANIFQRFYKSKISNKKDSVGIGLSIAKTVIDAHGGYIDVMSTKGEGTTFVITFPTHGV